MRKKFLMICMTVIAGVAPLWLASCSSDDAVAACDDVSSEHYSPEGTTYISLTAEKGTLTRSTLQDDGTYLNFQWNKGDSLVVVEPTYGVIGKIGAKENSDMSTGGGKVTAQFSGKVKGKVVDGDVLRFYYLGNKSVAPEAKSITCDFSTQEGTLASAAALRYAATGEVTMKKEAGETVAHPESGLSLSTQVSLLKFNITYDEVAGHATKKYTASKVVVTNLNGSVTINLCDGTMTPSVATITMANSSKPQYYYMAVPVEGTTEFTSPSMTCTFPGATTTEKTYTWSNKWTIGPGAWYAGQGGNGMVEAYSSGSTKDGYSGYDLASGYNLFTSPTTKDGYAGYDVTNVYSVTGSGVTKNGYSGNDVEQ